MEDQKMKRKAWLILIVIFALPFAIAIIIYAATRVFKPYAQQCNKDGIIMSHMEQITLNCNTCTCNNSIVTCTEMDCSATVKNEDEALAVLKVANPEFKKYPYFFGREGFGKSTLKEDTDDGWYITFIEEDRGGIIKSGNCFFVNKSGEIEKIGDAIPDTNYIDVKTCREPLVKTEDEEEVITEKDLFPNDYEKILIDLDEDFFYGEPFPETVANYQPNDLLNIKCSDWYYKSFEKQEFYNEESTLLSSTSTLSNLIDRFDTEETITQASLCETEDGRLLFRKIEESGGGGLNNKSTFTWLNNNNEVIYEGTIDNKDIGAPYFLCKNTIYISEYENTKLYHICDGGDGGYGMRSIYEVNLKANEEPRLIYKCESYLPVYDIDPENKTLSCESY